MPTYLPKLLRRPSGDGVEVPLPFSLRFRTCFRRNTGLCAPRRSAHERFQPDEPRNNCFAHSTTSLRRSAVPSAHASCAHRSCRIRTAGSALRADERASVRPQHAQPTQHAHTYVRSSTNSSSLKLPIETRMSREAQQAAAASAKRTTHGLRPERGHRADRLLRKRLKARSAWQTRYAASSESADGVRASPVTQNGDIAEMLRQKCSKQGSQ